MSLRVLIVDDEPVACRKIRRLLQGEPDVEIIGECFNGPDAIAAIERHAPDLVYLDVQMPGCDGFEVLQGIGSHHRPVIVFVTAYDEHAVRAFEAHAVDYLLKPVEPERLRAAMRWAREQLAREQSHAARGHINALIESLKSGRGTRQRLLVKSPGRAVFINVDEIDWIEAEGNYARLHVGREAHLLRSSMTDLETRLDANQFVRIHRSVIVNVDRIKEFQPWFQGENLVILRDGTKLTLSRGYAERLQSFLKSS